MQAFCLKRLAIWGVRMCWKLSGSLKFRALTMSRARLSPSSIDYILIYSTTSLCRPSLFADPDCVKGSSEVLQWLKITSLSLCARKSSQITALQNSWSYGQTESSAQTSPGRMDQNSPLTLTCSSPKMSPPRWSQCEQTSFLNEISQVFIAHLVILVSRLENYFQASRDKCKEFEALLIKFTKLIDGRQFENKFGIKSKSLQEYKIQDVLEIAEKVQTKHDSISKFREHTAVFRKCFAAFGRNQGAVDNLLNIIPNDSYGSIIFGEFTLILTVGSPGRIY